MNQRLLRFLLICFLLPSSPLFAYDAPRWAWKPIWPINGGLNIVDNKEQLPIGQLLSCDNFLWSHNQLIGREGFQQYVASSTSGSINFLSLFKKSTGESYLIYSDGKGLWSVTLSNGLRTELVTGSSNKGTVTIATGTKVLHGNTVADEKWRTLLGTNEGTPIIIGSRTDTIAKILLDTLLLLKNDLDTGYIAGTYSLTMPSGNINAALQSNDLLYIYGDAGTRVFTDPTSYTKPESLFVNRYHLAAPYIKRHQWSSTIPSLMFKTNDSISTNYNTLSNFLRLTTDPKSNVAGNPITAGHHFYMSYPLFGAYANPDSFYVGGAAFMPDSVGSGAAEYFVVEELSYDLSSRSNVIVDSVKKYFQDTSGWSGSPAAYEKIWLHSKPDTLVYATGDWFVSPPTPTTLEYGTTETSNYLPTTTVVGTKGHTPNTAGATVRLTDFWTKSWTPTPTKDQYGNWTGVTVAGLMHFAVYNCSDSTLVDSTSQQYSWSSLTAQPFAQHWEHIVLKKHITLLSDTNYFFLIATVKSGSNYPYYQLRGTGGLASESYRMTAGYSTTWTAKFVPTTSEPTYNHSVKLGYLFNDTMVTPSISRYPIAGGYVTADSAILAASPDSAGFVWSDSCHLSFYRMKRSLLNTSTDVGVDNVAMYQLSTFEVRVAEMDRVYWSEVSDPDSFRAGNFMVLEYGNPIIVMGEQLGNLVAYTKTNRWKIFPFEEGSFATEKLNGSRGCVAKNSFLNIDNVHYGLASDGYWECSGDVPLLISDAISTYFTDSINTNQYRMIAAGYDQVNDDIWLSFPTGTSLVNNVTLVYHRPTKSWWRQSFNSGAYTYNSDRSICDSAGMFVGGTDSNTIYIKRGVLDGSNSITSSLQTGFYDFGLPDKAKVVKSLLLNYDSPSGNTVTLGLRRMSLGSDTEFTYSEFGSNSYWSQKIVNVVQGTTWGRHFSFSLNVSNASGFKVGDYQVLITSDRKIKQ